MWFLLDRESKIVPWPPYQEGSHWGRGHCESLDLNSAIMTDLCLECPLGRNEYPMLESQGWRMYVSLT